MSKSITIYGLVDPRNDELRYVGKTVCTLSQRLYDHMRRADEQNCYSRKWLYQLKKKGLSAEIIELERDPVDWREAECYWIAYFKSIGCRLTNQSKGGQGPNGVFRSPDVRKKMGDAQRGKKRSEWHRLKIGLAGYGRKKSADSIERTAKAHRGARRSDATRQRMSEARLRNGTTDKQREALRNLHAHNQGRNRSEDTKRKIAEALRKHWAGKR